MFHYESCGLKNIWLKNGFEFHDTPYSKGVAIHDVDGLHKAIGMHLINNKPRLSPSEVRFLRKELNLSQVNLAMMLGVGESTVRSWEGKCRITPTADRLLREIYKQSFNSENTTINNLLNRLSQIDRDNHEKRICLEETNGVWKQAA